MPEDYRVVVCASGGGGNFQALVDARAAIGFSIPLLIVDRPCGAVERAAASGIPCANLAEAKAAGQFEEALDRAIPADADLVVLAGFMPIVPKRVCDRWRGRMINTHPSLLPKYGGRGMYGVKVQEAVLKAGDARAGCTVHYVTEQIDGGAIILQKEIDVDRGETPWQLGGRVFREETKLLVEAVRMLRMADKERRQ